MVEAPAEPGARALLPTLLPLLTFLGQHGDEGTDELVVVVGSPLVIDLQIDCTALN